MADKTALFMPKEYLELAPEQKNKVCNGCGTKGLGGFFVPDTLWGLDIEEACNIHDFMYSVGKTQADKDHADLCFYNNMLLIIQNETSFPPLKLLRRRRAKVYYEAVSHLGHEAFWKGKEKPVT